MRKLIILILLILTACRNHKEIKSVEISCGQCQFELNSEDGCSLAIRIDDKAYFVDGFDIDAFGDAHDEHTGFCEVIRQGTVKGTVKNERFIASAIKLTNLK